MRYRKWGIFVGMMAIGGLIAAGWWQSMAATTAPGSSAAAISQQRLRTHVSALGTLAPCGRTRNIAAPASFTRVGQLLVEEGDFVVENQTLAIADDHRLRVSELEYARAQVAIAQYKLDKALAGPDPSEVAALRASLESSMQSHEQRQRDWERLTRLASTQSVSASEEEEARLRLSVASKAVEEIKAKLQLLKTIRPEDVRVLEAELRAAECNFETARQQLTMAQITAPLAGTVLRVHARAGERPKESGILELGDTRRMQVIAEVYEADAPLLKVGANATIHLKSIGLKLKGKVVQIQPQVGRKSILDNDPVSDADARVVEVIVDLEPSDCQPVQALSNARVEVIFEVQP